MLRTDGMPDDSGWYWIDSGGEWHMVYLWAEQDEPELALADPEHATMKRYYPRSPAEWRSNGHKDDILVQRWIGPLECPGGDFPCEIAEWSTESHDNARTAGKALVMVAVDLTHCPEDRTGWRTITTGIMDHDEAMAAAGRVFETKEE